MGNRNEILLNAKMAIASTVGSISIGSPLIESEAWGFESEQAFLNQVLVVDTPYSAIEVLDSIQEIEFKLGRVRKSEQWVSRPIDIDILFYNNDIIENSRLSIPHKHIQDRRFTLYGLNLILPDYFHPKLKVHIKELLQSCEDNSKVEVYHA